MCSIEGAEAPSCLHFATDKYLMYIEEAKCRQDGCIGDRIPLQLWRGTLGTSLPAEPLILGRPGLDADLPVVAPNDDRTDQLRVQRDR